VIYICIKVLVMLFNVIQQGVQKKKTLLELHPLQGVINGYVLDLKLVKFKPEANPCSL